MNSSLKIETLYSEEQIDTISDSTGLHKNQIRMIISKFSRMILNPDIIDNEDALIKAYMDKYREISDTCGEAAAILSARNEVSRLITLGKEARKLREMVAPEGEFEPGNNKGYLHSFHGWSLFPAVNSW